MKGKRFQLYMDRRGGWRWRLLARNGRIVADSGECYRSKRNVHRAVQAVVRIVTSMGGTPRVQWASSATARRR